MKQITFNYYFIVSALFVAFTFLVALTDTQRNLIDNTGFLLVILFSLINFIYATYLFNQPIKK